MKIFTVYLVLLMSTGLNLLSQTKDLVVIDEKVEKIDLLKGAMNRNAEVLLVNDESEIWFEIYRLVTTNPEITQVHLLLPASEGELYIGGTVFDEHSIGDVLDLKLLKDKEISLLFYGSNLAEVEEGKNLVNKISELTHLHIAASTTTTAGQDAGGDWNLEYQSDDKAEFEPLFNADMLTDYPYNF